MKASKAKNPLQSEKLHNEPHRPRRVKCSLRIPSRRAEKPIRTFLNATRHPDSIARTLHSLQHNPGPLPTTELIIISLVDSRTYIAMEDGFRKALKSVSLNQSWAMRFQDILPLRWYRDEKIFQLKRRAIFSRVGCFIGRID